MKAGGQVMRLKLDGTSERIQAKYLFAYQGISKVAIETAEAGEIVTIGGLKDIQIGETLADVENPEVLPAIKVQQPTVQMTFGVNTSPLSGREGKWSTSRKLWERLTED